MKKFNHRRSRYLNCLSRFKLQQAGLMLLMSICFIYSPFVFSQENCYDFLRRSKDWNFKPSVGSPSTEILVVATFHFRKKFNVEEIEKKLIAFNPEMIFVEEVSPIANYKEAYMNQLYKHRGKHLYSLKIDSLVTFTGINLEKATNEVVSNYKLIQNTPNDLTARANLINALFTNRDEANANYQWRLLNKKLETQSNHLKDSIQKLITPYHKRFAVSAGETRYLSTAIAEALAIEKIDYMDYQADRELNDSLLSLTIRKVMPRMALKFWKLPYLLKMQKMDAKGPASDAEAVEHIKILNKKKTILQMAKLNEKYFRKKNVKVSIDWNNLYRKRNCEMVKQVLDQTAIAKPKKALIVVGASHVPYFIWELRKQNPQVSVTLLSDL